MHDLASVIDQYVAMWNETDPDRRSKYLAAAFAEDGRHVDPVLDATGHADLAEMVAGVQAQFPDHTLRRTSAVDAHHDQVRFAWELSGPDGTVAVAGTDIANLAPDGRLRLVTGFWGDLAAEEAA